MSFKRPLLIALLAVPALLAGPASAQIALPSTPNLPLPLERGTLERLPGQVLDRALQAPSGLRDLIRRSDGALQADPRGWPIVTGEVVAIGLSARGRAAALEAGFTILTEERLDALDLSVVVLSPPRRLRLDRAVERLSRLDPDAEITFNHIHGPAGVVPTAPAGAPASPPPPAARSGAALGLIDTGVNETHPALASGRIVQQGFAGPARAGAHGTAVASLMVGRAGAFSGAAPGRALLVADIYGQDRAGGSATALARALAWMVEQRAGVVNVSLVGPRNALIERAVASARARGLTLVAAAGNDGPAAAPLFPASYEGVIGVAAVNGANRILPESARGPQIDLVAPGADMAAASASGGYVSVRGSSFAAPIVAGLIAREGSVQAVARTAQDLGARGPDTTFGAGLVGADLRVAPAAVDARGRLAR